MKKMYKHPQTETLSVGPVEILCVSGDGRVSVDAVHPINFYHKVE